MAGDPQILEVELAKLKVLVNDIAAHQASVDTLNEAGAQIVQQGTGMLRRAWCFFITSFFNFEMEISRWKILRPYVFVK